MEVKGKIHFIGDTQSFGSNNFQKREVVVTTEEQYPQKILIEFVQDKCAILDNYDVGEKVSIAINLRGREWTNPEGEVKYFNSIQGWKITRLQGAAPVEEIEVITDEDEDDDLPF